MRSEASTATGFEQNRPIAHREAYRNPQFLGAGLFTKAGIDLESLLVSVTIYFTNPERVLRVLVS